MAVHYYTIGSYYAIPDADMWEYFRRNASLHYDPVERLVLTNPSSDELAPGFLELITDWLKQRVQIVKPDEH
jgi:hypothetical protein